MVSRQEYEFTVTFFWENYLMVNNISKSRMTNKEKTGLKNELKKNLYNVSQIKDRLRSKNTLLIAQRAFAASLYKSDFPTLLDMYNQSFNNKFKTGGTGHPFYRMHNLFGMSDTQLDYYFLLSESECIYEFDPSNCVKLFLYDENNKARFKDLYNILAEEEKNNWVLVSNQIVSKITGLDVSSLLTQTAIKRSISLVKELEKYGGYYTNITDSLYQKRSK